MKSESWECSIHMDVLLHFYDRFWFSWTFNGGTNLLNFINNNVLISVLKVNLMGWIFIFVWTIPLSYVKAFFFHFIYLFFLFLYILFY